MSLLTKIGGVQMKNSSSSISNFWLIKTYDKPIGCPKASCILKRVIVQVTSSRKRHLIMYSNDTELFLYIYF